jgi:hypothetical protein
MWALRRLTTLWASTACYGDGFTFLYLATITADSLSIIPLLYIIAHDGAGQPSQESTRNIKTNEFIVIVRKVKII